MFTKFLWFWKRRRLNRKTANDSYGNPKCFNCGGMGDMPVCPECHTSWHGVKASDITYYKE